MQEWKEKQIEEFVDELASSAPTPGGGGAAALVGAVGVALGHMVGSLTVGKKKYADVESDIKDLMERAEKLQNRLLALIDEDGEAFAPLARAYGLPAETEEQRVEKDRRLEGCLVTAAQSPLDILDGCCEALDLLREYADKGSRMVISDAATGAALCLGALKGAAINVKVNTNLMKDRAKAGELEAHVNDQLERYEPLAVAIYEDVLRTLSHQ